LQRIHLALIGALFGLLLGIFALPFWPGSERELTIIMLGASAAAGVLTWIFAKRIDTWQNRAD
jgi:hypothetical protein